MKCAHRLLKILLLDVGVYLCGFKRTVSKQLLYHTQIRSADDE